jgi:hypothetical protein
MSLSRVRHLVGLLLGWLSFISPTDAAVAPPEPSPVRATLRADWTNPNKSSWIGIVRLSEGRIESARPLELRAGQVRIESAVESAEIRFRTDGPTAWCGVEFVVEASPRASVELEIDGHRLQAPLEELLKGSTARIAWDGSARLRRDPADILQVKLNRPHLIFAPGEPVRMDLEFNLLASESRVVDTQLHLVLRSTRDGKRLFALQDKLQVQTNAADSSRQTVNIRTPATEGAFDLVVRAEPDGMQPVERVVQFVVLDPNAASPPPSELVTRVVEEIDPAQPNSGERWYSTRRLKAHTTRLGQFLWTSVRHPFTPRDRAKESPILTCRLNAENPGLAHLLSIEYEDAGDLLLAASISEQDPDGRWLQVPVASGVRTSEKPASGGVQIHQLVFWPQTKSPNVSLYLQAPAGIAAVKKIRLLELPQGLPLLDLPDANPQRRLFGLYLDNPDQWASWGSARGVDPATNLPLDDWRTFLLSMSHIAEYARFAGYNCIQPTVVGQGGAMYPSKLLDANYRLDSGFVADSAPDPMRKDAVELLLRICQRNRLGVVPSMRLDGAIVELDRKVKEIEPQSSGVLLVSRDGQTWDGPPAASTSGRRYNPLNADVQAAMLAVVREFLQKYAAHPAFEALAIDLATPSHLVLPGLDWGYDDRTVSEFIRDTGVEPPAISKDDPARFGQRHQWLTAGVRDQWIAWRCRKLASFYEAVLAEVQQARPTGRLIVDLTTLSGPGSDDPRDSSRAARTVEETLRSRGIDLRNWAAPRDLVLLRPFAAAGSSPEGLQLNASRELDELLANLPSRGSLCIHEPEVLHFASTTSADKPTASAPEAITLPVIRPGRLNLRRYAQSLAGSDCQAIFEGGPAVPLGYEQVQREFAGVFRSLPNSAFQPVETLQPVVVRSFRGPRDTFIYMVNDASYAVETNLTFDCPPHATLSNDATGDKLAVHPIEHGLGTKIGLEPFQTVCLKLSGADASVAQCNVIVPQAAEKGLKVRFDRLHQAMMIMSRDSTRTLDGIPPNGDFEIAADDENIPANWTAEGERALCAADRSVFHAGGSSLRLEGKPGSVVAGDSFTPPEARAIAMNVWLRAARPGQRVRWFLVGNHNDDTIYRCYADVSLGTNWEQKQFRAVNLPEGQLTEVQIKFQLLDEGTVWIDDARVCALPISQDEKLAITKSIAATLKAWKENRWSDFERLSDGYWATYLIDSVERTSSEPESPQQDGSR